MKEKHLSADATELLVSLFRPGGGSLVQVALGMGPLALARAPKCPTCVEHLRTIRNIFPKGRVVAPLEQDAVCQLIDAAKDILGHMTAVQTDALLGNFGWEISLNDARRHIVFSWTHGPAVHDVTDAISATPLARLIPFCLRREPSFDEWMWAFSVMASHFGVAFPLRLSEPIPGVSQADWSEWGMARFAGERLEDWARHLIDGTGALPAASLKDIQKALVSPSPIVRQIGLHLMATSYQNHSPTPPSAPSTCNASDDTPA